MMEFGGLVKHLVRPRLYLYSNIRRKLTTKPPHSRLNHSEGHKVTPKQRHACIALGSNMDGRLKPIEEACREINKLPKTKVVQLSHLWNTKAEYVENQDDFLNGVCAIGTWLKPIELLDALQGIENKLGRVKLIDKGPRNIDLDILTYGQEMLESERLTIPHQLMRERLFVLRPLLEIHASAQHPADGKYLNNDLHALEKQNPEDKSTASPLTFLSPTSEPIAPLHSRRQTRIMSILNFTPDSFSDGGSHTPSNPSASFTPSLLANSDIIDIGGESTRPGSSPVTPEEELKRILPAIQYAASVISPTQSISVDTYHASVADEALKAGAHIINDISAGRLDKDMFVVVAKHNATIILGHSRGTPQTMMDPQHLEYGPNVWKTVHNELLWQARNAQKAGIPPWRIILDPGLGFSKTYEQNLELMRDLFRLRKCPPFHTYAWCVGLSRKKFVQMLAGDAEKVGEANKVALMASIAGGADIIRVHEPEEAKFMARVMDQLH